MFETDLRTLSFVDRWGTVRRLHRQNVAEHMYFVAVYANEIAKGIAWKGDYAELNQWSLAHDAPEHISGDIQGPTKRAVVDRELLEEFEADEMGLRLPGSFLTEMTAMRGALDPEVIAIVKCADIMDECMWLAIEMSMGNMSVEDVLIVDVLPRARAAWVALPTSFGADIWDKVVLPHVKAACTSTTRSMTR